MRRTKTLTWIKADLTKHWATYIGFSGLIVIGIPLFLLIREPIAERLVLILLCWMFCSMGLFWEAQSTRLAGYISDEERNKPYDDWEGFYITLPCLPHFPSIRRRTIE